MAGGIHALFLSYVTVGEVFTIAVPLTVVLMSVLGGTRHWAGPAVGAVAITALLYSFTAADHAVAGKALIGAILIAAILFMPDGILLRLQRLVRGAARRRQPAATATPTSAGTAAAGAAPSRSRRRQRVGVDRRRAAAACAACTSRFKGVHALTGVDVDVRRGEILGLLGPNGSGKSTFINVVSGHYARDGGRDRASRAATSPAVPAHRIAARRHRAHLPDPAAVRAPDACCENVALRDDVRRRASRDPRSGAAPRR